MNLRGKSTLLVIIFVTSLVFAVGTGFLKDKRQKEIALSRGEIPATSLTPTTTLSPKATFFPIRVEPPHNSDGVSTSPQIVVYFNEIVGSRKVDIKVTPSFEFNGSFDSNGRVLTINPATALSPKTKYTVAVLVDSVTVYSWEFSTGDASLTNTEAVALAKLKDSLPYKADHFWIDYKANSDTFYVYIDAKPLETYQNQALAYFRSKGVTDTSKLKLDFVPIGDAAKP